MGSMSRVLAIASMHQIGIFLNTINCGKGAKEYKQNEQTNNYYYYLLTQGFF